MKVFELILVREFSLHIRIILWRALKLRHAHDSLLADSVPTVWHISYRLIVNQLLLVEQQLPLKLSYFLICYCLLLL